jgi:hypothetical protein
MSRILRRPLFRGGAVSSYGTGIASGLADGGRVGYATDQAGGQVLGKDLVFTNKYRDKDWYDQKKKWEDYTPKYNTEEDWEKGYLDKINQEQEIANMYFGTEYGTGTFEEKKQEDADWWATEDGKKKWLYDTKQEQDADIKEANKYREDDEKIITEVDQKNINKKKIAAENERIALLEQQLLDLQKDKSNEASTEINKEEIFKMLGGDKARVQDMSDWALQFFGKTVGEGQGWKEAAGQVATDIGTKPSRTEKLSEAAAMMTIKDKFAQRQSDRDIKKLLGIESAKVGMRSAAANPKNLDWAGKKAYYADVLKTGSLKSNEVIRASIQATESEEGKKVTATTDLSVISNPENFEAGIYVVDGGEKGKEVIEIIEDESGNKKAIPRDEFVI